MPRNYFTPEETNGIYAARTYILHHLHLPLKIKKLTQVAGLGKRRLNEGFYYYFERNVPRFIHETRLRLGSLLLNHTHWSIKEIAYHIGYRHPKNFLTAYRKFFGTTPGYVRNNHT